MPPSDDATPPQPPPIDPAPPTPPIATDSPGTSLPPKTASRPTGKQLLILLGGGFVLAFGGCLLAIATAGNGNDITPGFVLFAIVFFAGLLMMVAGAAATVVKLIIVIFRKR